LVVAKLREEPSGLTMEVQVVVWAGKMIFQSYLEIPIHYRSVKAVTVTVGLIMGSTHGS
jgi:hypothetical protein